MTAIVHHSGSTGNDGRVRLRRHPSSARVQGAIPCPVSRENSLGPRGWRGPSALDAVARTRCSWGNRHGVTVSRVRSPDGSMP